MADTLADIASILRHAQSQTLAEQIAEVVLRNERRFSTQELVAALQAEIDRLMAEP